MPFAGAHGIVVVDKSEEPPPYFGEDGDALGTLQAGFNHVDGEDYVALHVAVGGRDGYELLVPPSAALLLAARMRELGLASLARPPHGGG